MDNHFKHIETNLDGKDPFFNPSDKVWDGINSGINPSKKSKKRFWQLLLYCLIGITLGVYFVTDERQNVDYIKSTSLIDSLDNNITSTDENIAVEKNSLLGSKNTTLIISKQTNKYQKANNKGNTQFYDNNENQKLTLSSSKTTTLHYQTKSTSNKDVKNVMSDTTNDDLTNYALEKLNAQEANTINFNFNTLQKLTTPNNGIIYKSDKYQLENNIISHISQPVNNIDIKYIALQLGYFRNINKMSIAPTASLSELVRQSKYDDYLSFGLESGKSITHKALISVGINYTKSQISTSYDLSIPYDLSKETHDPATGTYNNTFDHTLPTIGGSMETSITFRRSDNSQIDNNTPISLDFDNDIIDQSINIPILVRRYFTDNYSGLFLLGGVQAGGVLKREISNIHLQSYHDIVNIKQGVVGISDNFNNNYSLTANIGIGYSYHLINKISLDATIMIDQKILGNRSSNYFIPSIMARYNF